MTAGIVLRQIAGCHYRFEIDVYRQLIGLWQRTICGMLSIEIVPFTDTSVREDEFDASFGLEDVVEDRIEDALIVTFALWNFTLDPRDLAASSPRSTFMSSR